jgi:anti-repressor protein
MNEIITAASAESLVFVHGGHVMTDSRIVADVFGKQHKNVLRDIEVLDCSTEFSRLNFEPTSVDVIMPNGGVRRDPKITMTRDGFMFLAMGFRGAKAATWKEKLISAFNAMEAQLKATLPDLDDPVILQQLLSFHTAKRIEAERRADAAEKVVEAAKPKTLFYDKFAGADGAYSLQNAARILGQGPNKFIRKLKEEYLFYQGSALVPKVKYREMGLFEVKVTLVDDKARHQTFVTPKGLQYFSKVVGCHQLPLMDVA